MHLFNQKSYSLCKLFYHFWINLLLSVSNFNHSLTYNAQQYNSLYYTSMDIKKIIMFDKITLYCMLIYNFFHYCIKTTCFLKLLLHCLSELLFQLFTTAISLVAVHQPSYLKFIFFPYSLFSFWLAFLWNIFLQYISVCKSRIFGVFYKAKLGGLTSSEFRFLHTLPNFFFFFPTRLIYRST